MMKINIKEASSIVPQNVFISNLSSNKDSMGINTQSNEQKLSAHKANKKSDNFLNIFPKSNEKQNLSIFPKANDNQHLSLFPNMAQNLKNSTISAQENIHQVKPIKMLAISSNQEKENNNNTNIHKKKNSKGTFISLHNPLRNSQKNIFARLNQQKNTFYHKHKLSLDSHFFPRRNSHNINSINFFRKKKSKKNLKQIERELQFKILDMSIRMENDSENEDDISITDFDFLRKQKKRYTENPKKRSVDNFNKTKTGEYKHTNSIIKLSQIKANADLKKELENKSPKNKTPKNNNLSLKKDDKIGRRQSYIPKSVLMGKFEKQPQLPNERLNLSVNMNLYRDLIPNINNQLTEEEKTCINNKSMLITKKKINIKKILLYSLKNEEFENKYRILMRNKELYDSYEDEEVIEELEDEYFFISPETHPILIFDTLLLLTTIFVSFYLPLYIAQSKCFCSYVPKPIEYVLFFHEFINIIDIFISFFRAYYNFEFVLIKQTERIVIHYLKTYFFPDLFSAIPFYTISYYLCNHYKEKPDSNICFYNGIDLKYNMIKMTLGLKIIKLLKVLHKKVNRGINYFYEVISENYTLEKTVKMLLFTVWIILGFNFFICYHIYIGFQSYPNWILKTNNQDASFMTIYISSFYFLIATITSVGYGDITCISLSETLYQIIILTIGVIAYSWIVSTIGNYVKKETRAAIKYNKDISLLEEIRISYPKMSFKLYNKIHKHLETVSHQQEKLDTNLLVTNLPYTLKNQIMFIIYGSIIKKFIFFKDCENSDFILRVLTSFIPLTTKKGAVILQEGEIIDNIVFVREGRLSLVATIDLDNPLLSIDNYLGEKFEDINDQYNTKLDNSIMDGSMNMGLKKEKMTTVLKTVLKTKADEEENIEQEIAKKDFNGEDIEIGNVQYLNILDILKNEHYGIVYMLLKKPAPLSLRVKSKYSQLFLLRKVDTMQISKAYPNVWKKIYFKSYHNMKSIKHMTRKVILNYCRNYGIKYNVDVGSNFLDNSRKDTDFFMNLGLLNTRTRKNTKKIMFNLDGNHNSNKNLIKPKPILKHGKNELLGMNTNNFNNMNNMIHNKTINKNYYKYQSFGTDNYNSSMKFGVNNNTGTINQGKANTNVNQRKMSIFSSNFRSNLGNDKRGSRINQINQINQINNNINYNIVINDVDMNNDSKTLLKSEDKKRNSLMKNSLRNNLNHFGSINTLNKDNLKKSNFMQNVPSKIKGLSNLRSNNSIQMYNPDNLNIPTNQNFDRIVTLNMPNMNQEEDASRNNTLQMNEQENKSDQSINTINNLSKSLLKKVKKKMRKRRKRKKMYKMLIQKITESLAKINPNLNLSSSMNNNSIIFSSKIGDVISINPELNYIIDEKPELNQNISQNINQNLDDENLNNKINLNNYNMDQPPFILSPHHEMIPMPNPQELFLIPESLEISSSESSSENSSESHDSSKKKDEEKDTKKNNVSKLNETPPKKVVELSISENTNFALNSSYQNLNKLSEGNYIKDENLQKSVVKLINVYLSEKEKPVEIERRAGNCTSIIERKSSIGKTPKILKDPKKEKDKEKNKEKDVWFYLEESNDSNKSEKNSFDKECKSPQMRHRKTNDYSRKKKTKRIYDNLFSLDETPKKRKTICKRKRRNINKTTLNKDTKKKKIKKKSTHNEQILNLRTKEDEDDEEDHKNEEENKNEKDKEKDKSNENDKSNEKDKDKNTLSSLEFSDIEDGNEQRDTYINNYYKTYQKKNIKEKNGKNKDIKSENISSENKNESKDSKDSQGNDKIK